MKRANYLIVAGIFLLNLLLKLLFLDANAIAGDEPFTIYHAQMSVSGIIAQLSQGNNPPMYELLMHFWMKFSGLDPFWMRFPSAVFSAITAVFIYLIGKQFLNLKVGIIAALLFTFSNLHIIFAHEVRVYAWFLMWTTIAMYIFLQFRKAPTWQNCLALILCNALLMYSHYFGFFIVVIQVICVVILRENRKQLMLRYCWISCGIILLFVPNLIVLLTRFSTSAQGGTWIEKPNGIEALYNMLWIFSNQPLNTILCLAILLAGIVVAIVSKKWRPTHELSKIALVWFLFPFLFLFAISYLIPVYIDRYVALSSIGYYLLIACVLDKVLKNRTASWSVSVVLVVIFAVTFKPNLTNKRDVKTMVEQVKSLKNSENTLLICGHDFLLNFCYYYDPTLFQQVNEVNVYETMENALAKQHIFALYKFSDAVPLKDEVIFLDAAADFANPGNGIYTGLEQKGYVMQRTTYVPAIFNVFEFSKSRN